MDLERGLLRMIDEYIFDAMAATGTRRAPRPSSPDQQGVAAEPDSETADLEPQTEHAAVADDSVAFIIDERNADASLLAQVHQQLADDEALLAQLTEQMAEATTFAQLAQDLAVSESAIAPLPRERAARGTIDLDDEVTNVLARAPVKPS